MSKELDDCIRELKMLSILQKEYTMDAVDFVKYEQILEFRKTLLGKISFCLGKLIAIYYIIRVLISMK